MIHVHNNLILRKMNITIAYIWKTNKTEEKYLLFCRKNRKSSADTSFHKRRLCKLGRSGECTRPVERGVLHYLATSHNRNMTVFHCVRLFQCWTLDPSYCHIWYHLNQFRSVIIYGNYTPYTGCPRTQRQAETGWQDWS